MLLNDFSNTFYSAEFPSGEAWIAPYRQLRKNWKPKYVRTWIEITAHWVTLIGFLVINLSIDITNLWITICSSAFVAVLLHRLHLFLHEGAHGHLAGSQKLNDVLTNIFVGALVLQDVAAYRSQHMLHHRYLGQDCDPERSYQSPLDLKFIAKTLFGVSALGLLLEKVRGPRTNSRGRFKITVTGGGFLLHLSILTLGLTMDSVSLVISWIVSVGLFFPLIAALRQLLEHSMHVDGVGKTSFPVTRIFDRGFLTFLIGAAGFDRHLLHHWDPGIPACRLSEMERSLSRLGFDEILQARRTSYPAVFFQVWGKK